MNFFNDAVKVQKRPFVYPYLLAFFKNRFRAGFCLCLLCPLEDIINICLWKGHGFFPQADESRHTRRALYKKVGIFIQLHLYQNVSRKELSLRYLLFTGTN